MIIDAYRFGATPPSGATWNPADKAAGIVLSSGNLVAGGGTNIQLVRATRSLPTGKSYWEVTLTTGTSTGTSIVNAAGIVSGAVSTGVQMGGPGANLGHYANVMTLYYNNSIVLDFANAVSSTHILQFAHDSATGEVWIGRVGTGWFNSGDPAAGTGEVYTLGAATWFPGATPNGQSATVNFGASAFSGSVPAGFTAYDSLP